ncbi:MAG: tetratricopeptide repeat protein [Actinomycetota bacterium]|nr:tetratricopeptide repeat protein [Actinomycetota bacterium]
MEDELNPDQRLDRAQVMLSLHRPSEAVSELRSALTSDPDNDMSRCLLAVAYLELGQFSDALREADLAAGCAPDNEWPHRLRSRALNEMGRHLQAVAAAEEAVRRDPSVAYCYVVLAESATDAGQLDKAETAAAHAVRLAPRDIAGHNALGLVDLRRQRWVDAERHFREALGCEPDNAEVLNNMGAALAGQGRHREAVHYFASSSRSNPRDEAARRNAAVTAVTSGIGIAIFFAIQMVRPLFTNRVEDVPDHVAIPLSIAVIVGSVAYFAVLLVRRSRQDRHPRASRRMMRILREQWFSEWRQRQKLR